jgi:hypothetical protein
MSDEIVEEPFKSAAKRVGDVFDQAAAELKAKIEKSKSEALKKITH